MGRLAHPTSVEARSPRVSSNVRVVPIPFPYESKDVTRHPWTMWMVLERSQERDQVRPLRGRQTRLQQEIEKLHGILQGEQSPIVQVRRGVLYASPGERLYGAGRWSQHAVDHSRPLEAVRLPIGRASCRG